MRLNHNIICVAALCLNVVVAKIPIGGVFTGINSATGERPARRDITEMRNDVPAFSLYIQALAAMQARSETDQLSWFQVAGIHGRPYYAWDWVGNRPGAPQVGYCTHSDLLFMSWHRPYLALYEQVMAKHAQAIAKTYNSATWQSAADKFRIPYWDWAAPPYRMPDWFSSSTISITTPTGVKSVTNPLMQYKFKRNYPETSFPASNPLTSYKYTVRRPNGNRVSDPNAVNAMLSAQAPSIAQQLYTVFSRATSYNNMATQSSSGPSFEGPHGWLHITVGGDGHMTDVGYSAFDPIFLLHHTNVDRLGAMWQAIYPTSFMTSATEGGGTWTLAPGQTLNSATSLLPFHRADGATPWTSDSARYTKTFGYSYPDVKDWLFTGSNGPSQLKSSVTARVNTLYNLRGNNAKRDIRMRSLRSPEGKVESRADAVVRPAREWTIDLSAPNGALGGASFTVLLFLGSKPADPIMWIVESVGALYVLAQPMKMASGVTPLPSRTEVVITEFLADRGIDTKDVEATKKYIDTNLIWGVQRADGSIVPNEQFKGLTVLVEDDIVKLPVDESELPKYSDKTVHPDVTPVNPVNPI